MGPVVAGLAMIAGCGEQQPADPGAAIVAQGALRGVTGDRVVRFNGVPYAAPPTGERRWAPPAQPAAWHGVRDATRLSIPCGQIGPDQKPVLNEDCLYLNITAPRAAADAPRPVMVWLHGGGLQAGSPNEYDPARMAADGGVVVVTVASRLNILGYFGHPGLAGSGQFGLMDEQAALRWVRANIAAFGGDPKNVTLFGESGGGARTCANIASPRSAGLFDKAIMQSGGCNMRWPVSVMPFGSFWAPVADIERDGAVFARAHGCDKGDDAARIACLRRLPIATVIKDSAAHLARAGYGTPTLPLEPGAALAAGRFNAVPVLAGVTRDEGRVFVGLAEVMGQPITEAGYAALLRDGYGDHATAIAERYPSAAFAGERQAPALAWAATITARMFACPAAQDLRLIGKRAPVFGYVFDDPNGIGLVPFAPGFPSGASHSGELPMLFDLTNGMPIDFATGKTIPRKPEQQKLAATMIRYWTNFARTSDPNGDGLPSWPRYAGGSLRLSTTPAQIAPVDGYRLYQCDFWDAI